MRSGLLWIFKTTTAMAKTLLPLLLFMILVHQGFSYIIDATLHRFCHGPMAEFAGGLPVDQRIGDGYCEQLVPLKSFNKPQARETCKLYGPFNVYDAKPEGDKTRCFWGPTVVCEADEVPFQKQCLKRLRPLPLASAKTACGTGTLLSVHNRRDAKWLLKLHRETGSNLWVSNGIESSRFMMPINEEIGFSNDIFNYDKNYKHVSLMGRNDFELYLEVGMLVPSDPLQSLPSFCTRPGIEVPAPGHFGSQELKFPPNTNVPHVYLVNQTVFLSGPFSFKEIQTSYVYLNVEDMYEHCSKYDDNAKPLVPTPDILTKLAEKGLFTGPVFILGTLSTFVYELIKCSGYNSDEFGDKFHIHDGDGEVRKMDQALWAPGYPKRQCTKYPASALVVNKHGKVENFPSNARLPVVCSVGVPPPVPTEKACPSLHSYFGQDKKCHCTNDSIDYVTMRNSDPNYLPGHKCIGKDFNCTYTEKKMFIFFVIEDDSVDRTNAWFTHAFSMIPENAGGGISRYTEFVRNYFNTTWDRQGVQTFLESPVEPHNRRWRFLELSLNSIRDYLRNQTNTDNSVFIHIISSGYFNDVKKCAYIVDDLVAEFPGIRLDVSSDGEIHEYYRDILKYVVYGSYSHMKVSVFTSERLTDFLKPRCFETPRNTTTTTTTTKASTAS